MLSLFSQIKEGKLKSSQVREITRKRSDKPQRTPAAITIDKTINLNIALSKIDLSTVEEHEKNRLTTELLSLKKSIENTLR